MRSQPKSSDNDSQIIWEDFKSTTKIRQSIDIEALFERDIEYITKFLINEGLLDVVKSGFGKVKDFASQKLLQPIVNMAMEALAKMDPNLAQQLAAAAKTGDSQQLQQLLAPGQKEADNITTQANQQPAVESYYPEAELNGIICNALVESGIITTGKSQLIQEKYILNNARVIFNSILEESRMRSYFEGSIIYPLIEQYTGTVRKDVSILKQNIKAFLAANPKMQKDGRFSQIDQLLSGMDRDGKINQQSQSTNTPSSEVPPETSEPAVPTTAPAPGEQTTASDPEVPTTAPVPGEQTTASDPEVPTTAPAPEGSQQKGILSKVWNYVSKNKITTALGALGLISIAAAALPVGGALAPIIAGAAASAKIGAAVGGTIGAAKGAVDDLRNPVQDGDTGLSRLKSAAKAGFKGGLKGAAKGSGVGAIGGAIGAQATATDANPQTQIDYTADDTGDDNVYDFRKHFPDNDEDDF
jgi:hypothetical protein